MNRGEELAWAAGLFEGEGCMSTFRVQHLQRCTLASKDEDVVRRFHRIIGLGVIDRQPTAHGYALWRWRAQTPEATAVMEMLLPYMGERRRARAEYLLAERLSYIDVVTYERECRLCQKPFRPAFSPMSKRQVFCSRSCYEHRKRGAACLS